MPVPSIPSFFEIQGDSSPVPGYNPDKRAQTLQPLSVFPLKENMWLPLLVLLFQTDAPTGTFSGSSFLYPVSEKTLQPFFFHNAIFHLSLSIRVPFHMLSANHYMVLPTGLW